MIVEWKKIKPDNSTKETTNSYDPHRNELYRLHININGPTG